MLRIVPHDIRQTRALPPSAPRRAEHAATLGDPRGAYFIEHPAVDPQTRPKTLDLYDTGERHNGQLDPEPPQSAWWRVVAPTLAADQRRLRVVNA